MLCALYLFLACFHGEGEMRVNSFGVNSSEFRIGEKQAGTWCATRSLARCC